MGGDSGGAGHGEEKEKYLMWVLDGGMQQVEVVQGVAIYGEINVKGVPGGAYYKSGIK